MKAIGQDTLKTRRTLTVQGKSYDYFSLTEAAKSLGDISRLPVSLKVLLENVLRFEDGTSYTVDDAKAVAGWLDRGALRQGGAVQARAHPAAGFHRRPRGGRSGGDARRDHPSRRRSEEGEPTGAGRSGDRPLRADRCLRPSRRAGEERRNRVRAQRRALQVPALGPGGLRQLPRGAAGHRHLPSGEPGVSRPVRVDRRGGRQDDRLSRHAVRHRQPHHDGQRSRHPRLGRRRHRGGGGDAGPADRHADPRRDRLPPDRQAAGGRHRHRSGADGDADAPPQGRGGQIRRILRARAGRTGPGRPRHRRQHGAGVWRDLRLLPGRQGRARLPAHDRPRRTPHRAGRGVPEGAGHVPRAWRTGTGVHRHAGTGSWHAWCRASPARSGRRIAWR